MALPKVGKPHMPTLFSVIVVMVILLAIHAFIVKKKG